ncbi:tetratricopeptide repeat protein [Anaerolineales bacterium HSG24]|nr:tetratricopeptide repeat protein [Anaerolineales bacterium HSG24]
MAIPKNLDLSGISPNDNFTGYDQQQNELQQLNETDGSWRAAIIHGSDEQINTDFVVMVAQQLAESFDVVKLIPLSEASTAQAVLDWSSGFLSAHKKQLKSKQVINFEKSKDGSAPLAEKIEPLIKLLSLRKVLFIYNGYRPEQHGDTELHQLLALLVENIANPSRFIITSQADFELGDDSISDSVGHVALESPTEEPPEEVISEETDEENEVETEPETTDEESEVETEPETTDEESEVEPETTDEESEVEPETTEEEIKSDEADTTPAEETVSDDAPTEVAEEIVDKTNENLSANQQIQVGQQHLLSNNHQAAQAAYEQALTMFKAASDQVGVALSTEGLGTAKVVSADYAQAQDYYEQALRIKQSLNDRAGTIELLQQLILVCQLQGDSQLVRDYTQQVRAIRAVKVQ